MHSDIKTMTIVRTLLLAAKKAKKDTEEPKDLLKGQWTDISFAELTADQKNKFHEMFNKTHGEYSKLFHNDNMLSKYRVLICDIDSDGIPNAFILYNNSKKFGNQIRLSGDDGSDHARNAIQTYKINLLNTPGWFCEVGEKQAKVLDSCGMSPISNRNLISQILRDEDIQWLEGNCYQRYVTGVGDVIKYMYGMPKMHKPKA